MQISDRYTLTPLLTHRAHNAQELRATASKEVCLDKPILVAPPSSMVASVRSVVLRTQTRHTTASSILGGSPAFPTSCTSACGPKRSASPSRESGDASNTSKSGRWRWMTSAIASRYRRGEMVTSIRTRNAFLPADKGRIKGAHRDHLLASSNPCLTPSSPDHKDCRAIMYLKVHDLWAEQRTPGHASPGNPGGLTANVAQPFHALG